MEPVPGNYPYLPRYRQLSKLSATIRTFPSHTYPTAPGTGRIHATVLQNGTATGRLSCAGPNLQVSPLSLPPLPPLPSLIPLPHPPHLLLPIPLPALPPLPHLLSQNIPRAPTDVVGPVGEELLTVDVRRAFKAPEGWVLVAADYRQIELRLLAHLAQDAALLAEFRAGTDPHTSIAGRLLGKPLAEVSPAEREQAKRVCYAILYGVSPLKLAGLMGVSPSQAELFMTQFLAEFPDVNEHRPAVFERCKADGGVRTLLGRVRSLLQIRSPIAAVRRGAERKALNTVIQGSASDCMKLAMLKCQDLPGYGNDVHLVMQVPSLLSPVTSPPFHINQATRFLPPNRKPGPKGKPPTQTNSGVV